MQIIKCFARRVTQERVQNVRKTSHLASRRARTCEEEFDEEAVRCSTHPAGSGRSYGHGNA